MKFYIPIVLALLLTSCVELGARMITDATYLAESAEAFVREVHDDRRFIRSTCREMLRAEVMQLQGEGRYAEARELLAKNYPALVTFQIAEGIEADDPYRLLNHPWPCTVSRLPTLSEAGLLE